MKKTISILFLFLFISSLPNAQIPERPQPARLVNDFAKVLNGQEQTALESKLVHFANETSNQIAIVTLEDLNGYDISDLAQRIGSSWEVGNGKFDNGLVILFKPKTSDSRGQVFIATGYGLEGAIPDITTKQIVEKEMIPFFKQGDVYGGFNQATSVLMDLARGEYNYEQYAKQAGGSGIGGGIVFFIIIIFMSMLFSGRRRRYYGAGNRGSSLPFWLALGLLGSNRGGGYYNNFNNGSGSFGSGNSFGGGGFGGFGGGGFGGGGAGGSW